MIQRQLKLKLRPAQERQLERWLWNLTGVWNWAVRKIELDARDGLHRSAYDFAYLLKGHTTKVGIPVDVLRGVTDTAVLAWRRHAKGVSQRPRLKGRRNRLNSIPFKTPIKAPKGNRINLLGMRGLKFHEQALPTARIKAGRIVRRASGWYLCLFIDAEPNAVPHVADDVIGIDPGFSSLLTLSTGEKIEHPRELEAGQQRLAQAQRGHRRKLSARLLERQGNRRRDRNHKLSRRLVARHATIAWSVDRTRAIARTFGKSVTSSSHYQLRSMLTYKCRFGGRQFIEVPSRNSTRICSACGSRCGPTGYAGLSVRTWTCTTCGVEHDRDRNAAVNTLKAGLGMSLERGREAVSGIARLATPRSSTEWRSRPADPASLEDQPR
jgi:putative transposase